MKRNSSISHDHRLLSSRYPTIHNLHNSCRKIGCNSSRFFIPRPYFYLAKSERFHHEVGQTVALPNSYIPLLSDFNRYKNGLYFIDSFPMVGGRAYSPTPAWVHPPSANKV